MKLRLGRLGKLGKGQKGFTLVEMVVVVAMVGIIAAVVVPNVGRFVGAGKDESWNADQANIQTAVDSYYAETSSTYPAFTDEDGSGQPTWNATTSKYDQDEGAIDMSKLATGLSTSYLHTAPDSASSTNVTGGTGSYTWYLDGGTVKSVRRVGTTDTVGYVDGTYP